MALPTNLCKGVLLTAQEAKAAMIVSAVLSAVLVWPMTISLCKVQDGMLTTSSEPGS